MSSNKKHNTKKTPVSSMEFGTLIDHYRHMLQIHPTSDDHETSAQMAAYAVEVDKPQYMHGRPVTPFAPFRSSYSALRTITWGQIFSLIALLISFSVSLYLWRLAFMALVLAVVTLFYFTDMLFTCLLSLRGLHVSTGEQIDDAVVHALTNANWPSYTILCPLYHESAVVPQLIYAIQRLDYPTDRLQVIILTQDDDAETYQALQCEHLPSHFEVVILPAGEPRTKPRACNYGILHATGEFVVIYDAEDIPAPLQLKKAILTFLNHSEDVACVQAKLSVYNSQQNLMTRWFTTDFSLWFDLTLPGLQSIGLPIPLGGTSNHFRTAALRMVGAWDAFNVTEDCDLGLRLAHYKFKTVMVDSTTYEEANSHLKNWIRQRSRWIKGYMQTYLVNMRRPWRYLRPQVWPHFFSLQFVVGAKTLVLLVNPLMWILLWVYIFFRPFVHDTYSILFPAPVLYGGTLCLIFGNFFYIYANMLVCLRHHRYEFIKWALLSPIYWFLMSVAAYIALFELIFRPHYWSKTEHGFHLQGNLMTLRPTPEQESAITKRTTQQLIVVHAVPDLSMHDSLQFSESDEAWQAISEQPAQSLVIKPPLPEHLTAVLRIVDEDIKLRALDAQKSQVKQHERGDLWVRIVILVSTLTGILALGYFFKHNQLLIYGDANSHLLIARRIMDNATPGFAQLGGVWLPLPHLLMMLFVWNDYLWHTGLAGSFVSLPCYVLASLYIFLSARRITRDNLSSFIGSLLFILNPNILYLQTTALTEPVLIATMTITCYYFLAWVQDDDSFQLVIAALGVCLATLTRYDGWFLFLALLCGIVVIGLLKHQRRVYIEGHLLSFFLLGVLGIVLWIVWCAIIFGDPLYFQRGPFSSQADQSFLIQKHLLLTYHDFGQSVTTFTLASLANMGVIASLLALVAFLSYCIRRHFSAETVGGLIFITPFAFYIVSLFLGQAAISVTSNRLYDLRYGTESIIPAAFFVAVLLGRLSQVRAESLKLTNLLLRIILTPFTTLLFVVKHIPVGLCRFTLHAIVLGGIIAQMVLIWHGGVVTWQDGQYGVDCAPHSNSVDFLAQHYAGGNILEDFYTTRKIGLNYINIPFKNIVYEGSGQLWQQAIRNPALLVDWVVANPYDRDDQVAKNIDITASAFMSQYIALAQEPQGTLLFHKKDTAPLPTRPLVINAQNINSLCPPGQPRHLRTITKQRSGFQAGVAFPQQGPASYDHQDVNWLNGIKAIQMQTGARWIEMTLSFTQDSLTSTIVSSHELTSTPDNFVNGIRMAHALGYHVFVAPLLFVDIYNLAHDASHWSGNIKFSNRNKMQAWFNSYWQALQPYLVIAAREKVEQFAVGTEDEWLAQNAPSVFWNTLIAQAHSIYPGQLTYDMNWSGVALPPADWMHNFALGLIGVSAYFPLVDQPQHVDARDLFTLWKTKASAQLDKLSEALHKPLVLSEVGFRNSTNAVYHTWDTAMPGQLDPEEQALACDATLLNTFDDPHIVGTFFWGWDNVSSFRLSGTSSVSTIHAWYASLAS